MRSPDILLTPELMQNVQLERPITRSNMRARLGLIMSSAFLTAACVFEPSVSNTSIQVDPNIVRALEVRQEEDLKSKHLNRIQELTQFVNPQLVDANFGVQIGDTVEDVVRYNKNQTRHFFTSKVTLDPDKKTVFDFQNGYDEETGKVFSSKVFVENNEQNKNPLWEELEAEIASKGEKNEALSAKYQELAQYYFGDRVKDMELYLQLVGGETIPIPIWGFTNSKRLEDGTGYSIWATRQGIAVILYPAHLTHPTPVA